MKLFPTVTIAALAVMATTSTSFGLIGLNSTAGILPVADGSQVNIVADLNQDGIVLTDPTSFAPGADDTVIASVPMNSFSGVAGGASFSIANIDVAGLTGADLYLVFYDLPFAESNTAPGEGVAVGAVGAFAANTFGFGGDAWTIQAENGDFTVNFVSDSLTQAFGLAATGFADPDFTAVTTPEPASLALLGLGGLLIARRRK